MRYSLLPFAFALSALSSAALALDIYPAKGQSAEKQATDTAKCQHYAKGETGFDPQTALSTPQAKPSAQPAIRARKRAKEEQQELTAEQQQQAQVQQKMKAYNEAESVCLKGKGYSVGG